MAAAIFATLAILASQGLMGCVLGNPIDVEATTTTREYVEKLCLDEATGERLNEQLVISVATKLNQDIDINCEDHVRDAFGDLSDIIKETRTSGCNRESVEAIAKYLPKAPKFSQFWQTPPREMYVFAIDYAMGMSKHCKQVMARVLLNNKQLEERDFSALERWTKKDSYVDQLIKRMSNIGLVSPGDVTAVIPDASILFKAININPESEPESVKIIRAVCSKRFKPVYEQVVAPVHLLSRAGIDYPNEHLMEEEMSDDDEAREKFELWNRIVLLYDTADLEQSFNHENTNGTPIVAPNQEIELVDGQYESSSESNEEEDDDESEFEQLAGEPVEQEGMSNRVEQLAEEEIERLISEIVEERRNPISRLTHKFIDAASELAMDLIEHGDIQRLIKCIRRESLFPNDIMLSSSKHHDCNWPKLPAKSPEPLGALFGGVLAVAVGALEELASPVDASQIQLGWE